MCPPLANSLFAEPDFFAARVESKLTIDLRRSADCVRRMRNVTRFRLLCAAAV